MPDHRRDRATPSRPRVSVVIRSYRRLSTLPELLAAVLGQDHDSFEVVVVEQTPEPTEAELAGLAPALSDPRVRLLKRPPLGGPGARNEGVKHARGDIVLLIDDDDLPLVNDWIATHEAAYQDPLLLGLTARTVRRPGEACPFPDFLRPFIRRTCLNYSVLKTPWTFGRFDEDVERIGWLHGTNSSFRRDIALRAGLWDTTVRASDEHSFAFRAQRLMAPGQYFTYRAYPPVLRRLDIRGGMDKRFVSTRGELLNNLRYCHQVVGRYFPWRYRAGYPAYLTWSVLKTWSWVQDPARLLTTAQKLRHFAEVLVELPGAVREIALEPKDQTPGASTASGE